MPANGSQPDESPCGLEARSEGVGGQPEFLIELDQYQGPLDALLDLVKSQEVDILDIPIAWVTEQYLEALRRTELLNIELSADFVLMASTLIHIKSRTLLPTAPSLTPEDDAEDPREDLVQQLLEREKFVQAAQMLKERRLVEEHVWTAKAEESLGEVDDEPGKLQVNLFDLINTFGDVLERLRNEPAVEVSPEEVSVQSRIRYLRNLLLSTGEPVGMRDLLATMRTSLEVISTFLALLEMVRARAVVLRQEKLFGEITITMHQDFDDAFVDGSLATPSGHDLEYS